jgi:(E)-4-hydroxy-3-methylbut-2-enyl-diphosphate synthase
VPVREAAEARRDQAADPHPLVADITSVQAGRCAGAGCGRLRLNPGNIGGKKFVMEVVNLAKDRKIPIRIGVNAGSLEKDLLEKHGGPTAKGMVESALRHIHILEECGYPELKVSLKASDPLMMIEASLSIGTTTPVTKLEASESSQTRVPIRSSGRPNRPMGVWAIAFSPRGKRSPVF